jgi:Subtilase family
LAQAFAEGRDPLELRADPAGLAPERLLVFELTADVQNFARAAANVPGLEFIGAEDLQGDEEDTSPSLYLMIPDALALQQMVNLWNRFQVSQALPEGLTPWRDLFAQLRALRRWGPQDRVSPEDLEILAQERADARGRVRVELELVFRAEVAGVERDALVALRASGGEVITRARIDGAKYHALLTDVPQAELQRVLARGQEGLVAAESVMHIRPQSAVHVTAFETHEGMARAIAPLPEGDPIAAIFDAVPLTGHPRLDGRLSADDPFGLEPLAVGPRIHGTAMASAVVHGDIAGPPMPVLDRRVFFVSVMFAPPDLNEDERFPDRLPADLFHEAVLRMKAGQGPAAPSVIVINASLGDRNKPFTGRMSGWARVVDYLSYAYGLLFVISAGNHLDDLVTADMSAVEFENLDAGHKARTALRASSAIITHRRILAPAESINAVTVGALHSDNFPPGALPASTFDVWLDTGLCTVSSGLGPGASNAVKPDVLAPGGRHHVRLLPVGVGHLLRPIGKNTSLLGGIVVATPAPPAAVNPDRTSRTVGTSVAAAIVTGAAARVHEALETAYDDFLAIPGPQRAVLLKALLVHCARWTPARDLIVEVLGPANKKHHVRQKDNIRRYLGYGAVDVGMVLECATDRATLWAVGRLQKEQSHTFSVPLPAVMSGKSQLHELSATVAWFAPPRVGAANYRGIRLRLVEPTQPAATFAVKAAGEQPDANQAHRGTVIHRRWLREKAAALGAKASFELMIQRQPDEIDDPVPYAVVTTVTMPSVAEVYAQVRDRVAVKPKVAVPL